LNAAILAKFDINSLTVTNAMYSACLVAAIFLVSPLVNANERLDQAYFGLELIDSRGAVQISWVDSAHRSAKNLNANDVVLSAGDFEFDNAAQLTELLQAEDEGSMIRFEVLALRDKKPRKVSVRAELLRTAIPRRFKKQRDREAQEVVHVPTYTPEQFYIAVVEGYDEKQAGLRVRYFPKDSRAVAEKDLMFWGRSVTPSSKSTTKIATTEHEFHYSGLSPEDEKKLPSLNQTQMMRLQREAYVELSSDRTTELLSVLQLPPARRINVGYNHPGSIVYNRYMLTDEEVRNMEWCLLLYQLLTEQESKDAKADVPEIQQLPGTSRIGNPTSTARTKAAAGWRLWQAKDYAGRTHDGYYTDPDSTTKVKDFWSDGVFARVDDTNDGMFETIFVIDDQKLRYIGTLQSPYIFNHIEEGEEQTVADYLKRLRANP